MLLKDVIIDDKKLNGLLFEKHKAFLSSYAEKCDEFVSKFISKAFACGVDFFFMNM
jgi:hypothetical protein